MTASALFDDVLHDLGLAIVRGEMPEGARLTLADIEARYGVSRTLSRDVVKSIEALGMVETRRRAGIVVLPRVSWLVLDPQVIAWRLESEHRMQQIESLTDVREAIEPMAARLASLHATDEQARRLVELASTLLALGTRGLGQSSDYLTTDMDFHTLLLEASGNEMLFAMRGMVSDVLRGRAVHGLHPAWPGDQAMESHLEIARAILQRDAERAELASRMQLRLVHHELGPSA